MQSSNDPLHQISSARLPSGRPSMGFTEDLEQVRSRLVAGAGGRRSWASVYPVDGALDNLPKIGNLNLSEHSRPMNIKRTRAFSLIELLVVIAVIGIVATFAIPAVQ